MLRFRANANWGWLMFLKRLQLLSAIVALLATPLTASAIGKYLFTDLGDLPGGTNSSVVRKMNSYGQVIGISNADPGRSHAFLWTPNSPNGTSGSMIDLGTLLPDFSPLVPSSVIDINSYGQVIVELLDETAFLWTPTQPNGTTGTMVIPVGIPQLPFPQRTRFTAINDRGQIVARHRG